MLDGLLSVDVDIFQCPAVDESHLADKGVQITIGDVHGNAIKPIFVTVKHGIARNMTEGKYQKFVQIYLRSFEEEGLSRADLLYFNWLLDSIDFKSEATIRWLGDLLADRGGNDYLTLFILARLNKCGVKYEIILSNHDVAFIKNYENVETDFYSSGTQPCFSMQRLQPLLDSWALDRADLNAVMRNDYLPFLKLISYTVNENNTSITIYSHAPIGLTNIDYMARKFGVSFDDSSLPALTKTIDWINEEFIKNYLNEGRISSLVSNPEPGLGKYDPKKDPVGYAIWNRDFLSLVRPNEHNDYRLQFAHGHHIDEANILVNSESHIHGLDNHLGKTISGIFDNQWFHNNKGSYTILYSHERSHLLKFAVANVDVSKRCKEIESVLVSEFFVQIDWLKEFVQSSDSVLAQMELDFLTQVHVLGTEAVRFCRLGNLDAAGSMADMCEALLLGFQKYLFDRDDISFQEVCRRSFTRIYAELHTKNFSQSGPIFVALAQSIEDLHVGVWSEELLPQQSPRLSDNHATLFSSVNKIVPDPALKSISSDDQDLNSVFVLLSLEDYDLNSASTL